MSSFLVSLATLITVGLMSVPGSPAQAQSQFPRQGKATLRLFWHYEGTAQRYSETEFRSSYRIFGVTHADAAETFGHGLSVQCIGFDEVTDLRKGTYPNRISSCVFQDNDGDMMFTHSACATETWNDWCAGRITSGTGKFIGFAGSYRSRDGGASTIRRHCIAAPRAEECQSSFSSAFLTPIGTTYRIEGEGVDVIELNWTR
jgi:hypothetical protein